MLRLSALRLGNAQADESATEGLLNAQNVSTRKGGDEFEQAVVFAFAFVHGVGHKATGYLAISMARDSRMTTTRT